MTAKELRQKYLDFFKSKGHTIIPSASLIPENDPSVLFTTAGMHPLIPYLMGEKHPAGKRLVSIQKCIRTVDIDDVGDNRHNTFFEMMGNWSLGDYFKKEAIEWSFEFLTDKKWLGLDPKRLYVTVFKGEQGIPRDEEAIRIWQETFSKAGIKAEAAKNDEIIKDDIRIIPLGVEDNFWIAGATGPCGGDTEMFYDTRPDEGVVEGKFSDLVKSFRLMEIWNNVFMEFNKTAEGKYEKLSSPNVDTGMGIERTLTVLNGKENVFETELFQSIFDKIKNVIPSPVEESNLDPSAPVGMTNEKEKNYRIIADHIKAATFMIADGALPSNVGRGYILRRLIRRAIRHGKILGIENNFTKNISESVLEIYGDFYKELIVNKDKIFDELEKEESKFRKTLEIGLKQFNKVTNDYLLTQKGDFLVFQSGEKMVLSSTLPGKIVFDLYTTYGFPIELTREIAKEKGLNIDEKGFEAELKKHQELSRTASAGMFKGGLADSGEKTTKLHTAAHLMLAALRQVLGTEVLQRGSNITAERLRFDFSHNTKMTPEQIAEVEKIVNEQIQKKLPVVCEEMTLEEAKKQGAMGIFESKYGEKVKVYTIGPSINLGSAFSREICGGPHVQNTGELGKFKIKKEESSSAGVRRIKAVLE